MTHEHEKCYVIIHTMGDMGGQTLSFKVVKKVGRFYFVGIYLCPFR